MLGGDSESSSADRKGSPAAPVGTSGFFIGMGTVTVLRTVGAHDHTSGKGQPAMLDTMVPHKADKERSRKPNFLF